MGRAPGRQLAGELISMTISSPSSTLPTRSNTPVRAPPLRPARSTGRSSLRPCSICCADATGAALNQRRSRRRRRIQHGRAGSRLLSSASPSGPRSWRLSPSAPTTISPPATPARRSSSPSNTSMTPCCGRSAAGCNLPSCISSTIRPAPETRRSSPLPIREAARSHALPGNRPCPAARL